MEKSKKVSVLSNVSHGLERSNFLDAVKKQIALRPDKTAFVMLKDGELPERFLTYAELDRSSMLLAEAINAKSVKSESALILIHSGLDFALGFLGAMYAGKVPVPVSFPSKKEKDWIKVAKVAEDAMVDTILTTSKHLEYVQSQIEGLSVFNDVNIILIDDLSSDASVCANWVDPQAKACDLAFLQYTSGSTGDPKGVMVSHENLLHNQFLMKEAYQHSHETVIVSWLPLYHDMGLIGNVLHTLYLGATCYLMTPVAFLQKPFRWLKAISDYQAHSSFAPNFAYQMCLDKVTEEQCSQLDLSSWKMALNGAEPVKSSTLNRFQEVFEKAGFSAETCYPAYGLAEATLFVSGIGIPEQPTIVNVSKRGLEQNMISYCDPSEEAQELVCCGLLNTDQEIVVADPETLQQCSDRVVGEILIKGKSVAQGYWNKPEATKEVFQAHIVRIDGELDTSSDFLRTGDLGYIDSDKLYITGRIKDVIIYNGANYYPQDIEGAVQASDQSFRVGYGSAFTINAGNQQAVVVVQEIERTSLRKINALQKCEEIRLLVVEQFQLPVAAVVLIKPMTLPLTSSGKIQRRGSRAALYANDLKEVGAWFQSSLIEGTIRGKSVDTAKVVHVKKVKESEFEDCRQWLRNFAERAIDSRTIDERRCIPPHIITNFANRGLFGLRVAEEFGGQGWSNQQSFKLFVQLAAIDTTVASMLGVHHALGTRPVQYFGNTEQKKTFLPQLASGAILGAFAITEEGAGSNPREMNSVAKPALNGGWLISGSKCWIGNAGWAGLFTVFVQVMDEVGQSKGITAFIVEADRPGLHVCEEVMTMGMRGMVQNRIEFIDMHVTEQDLLGEVGQGMAVAQNAMMHGRLLIASMALGAMRRSYQLMVRYAKNRMIGGESLMSIPATTNYLHDTNYAMMAVESMVERTALILDQVEEGITDVLIPDEVYAAIKIISTEFSWVAVDRLVQILGGRGYVENNAAPQLMRDVRLFRVFEGPTETLSSFLGTRMINDFSTVETFCRRAFTDQSELISLSKRINELPELVADACDGDQTLMGRATRWLQPRIGMRGALSICHAFLKDAAAQQPAEKLAVVKASLGWLEDQIAFEEFKFQRELPKLDVILNQATVAQNESDVNDLIGLAAYRHSYMPENCIDLALEAKQRTGLNRSDVVPFVAANIEKADVAETYQPSFTKQTVSLISERQNCDLNLNAVALHICEWIRQNLKNLVIPVSAKTRFSDIGIDSVLAVELSFDIQERYKLDLDSTVIWNYPTVELLAQHVVESNQQLEMPASVDVSANDAAHSDLVDVKKISDEELLSAMSQALSIK